MDWQSQDVLHNVFGFKLLLLIVLLLLGASTTLRKLLVLAASSGNAGDGVAATASQPAGNCKTVACDG